MPEYVLPRTGMRPLRFTGELLAEVSGEFVRGQDQNRYHDLALYRTDGENFVGSVTFHTCWQGEQDAALVFHAPDLAAVETALRNVDPCPPGIGCPPGERFREKQEKLAASLRRRYEWLISALFDQIPAAESAEGIA